MTNDRFGVLLACALMLAAIPALGQTFAVRDASPPGDDATFEITGVDSQGNAFVFWNIQGPTGNGIALRASRYVAATDTWSPAVDLSRTTDSRSNAADVAVDAAGNGIVVWRRWFPGSTGRVPAEVVASRYSVASGEWSPATLLSPPANPLQIASGHQVVVDAAGNATVVWMQENSNFYRVYAARYSPASGWATRVLAEGVYGHISPGFPPQVALGAAGNGLVTFARQTAAGFSIHAMRYSATTATWDAEQPVATPTCTGCSRPALAMDRHGNALLAWHGEPFGVLQAVRLNAVTGAWSSIEQISSQGFLPGIAADTAGNFIVTWQTTFGSSTPPRIQARRYASDTGTWGPVVPLSDAGASAARVVLDGDGNATVAWRASSGVTNAIQGARYTAATGTWSAATTLTTSNTSIFSSPGLDLDAAGHARVAWSNHPNTATGGVVQSTVWLANTTSPVPGPPTLTSALNGSTVTLSWTASPRGNPPTSYILEAGTLPGGSDVFNGNVGASTTLTASVGAGTYYVRVRAANQDGTGAPSDELTLAVGGAPGQPTITSAIASGGTVNVAWSPGPGPSATAHRLDFYSGGSLAATVTTGAATSVVIPIPAGTQGTFDVRVTAANGAVAGPSSLPMTFSIGAGCSPPASPTLSGAVVNGTASVNWTAVPGATSYVLSAGTTLGGTDHMPPTNLGANTGAGASGLPPGFKAYVRVFAVNACGQPGAAADFLVQ